MSTPATVLTPKTGQFLSQGTCGFDPRYKAGELLRGRSPTQPACAAVGQLGAVASVCVLAYSTCLLGLRRAAGALYTSALLLLLLVVIKTL